MPIEVAVLIVSYNSRLDLSVCLPAVLQANNPKWRVRVVVVDCASQDGSADMVEADFPSVDVVRLENNQGYAGGNNRGQQYIQKVYPNTKYFAVLNPDTRVSEGWLDPLTEYLEQHPDVAIVQPKLLLMDRPGHIDSAGNVSHVLGFGFVSGYGEPDDGRFDQVSDLACASGAAMLVRAAALDGGLLFCDDYFMYLEDVELSWRLRLAGHRIAYVPASTVEHRHDPTQTVRQIYYLERNRWKLLLTCYKWKTIIMLLPMIVFVELMVLAFAARRGLLREKLRSYRATFGHRRWSIQARRVISDRQLLVLHTTDLSPTAIRSDAVRRIINGLLRVVDFIVRPLLRG